VSVVDFVRGSDCVTLAANQNGKCASWIITRGSKKAARFWSPAILRRFRSHDFAQSPQRPPTVFFTKAAEDRRTPRRCRADGRPRVW